MIECPKCKHEHEPHGNHQDDAGEWTCDECGFEFVVEIEYEPTYSIECREHDFGPWGNVQGATMGYEDWQRRICSICDKWDVRRLSNMETTT